MGSKEDTLWDMKPHTKAKHIILNKYLGAWIPIISRHNGRVIYIDGFAGPGEYKTGEEGSPIIVINAVINHVLAPQMNAEFKFLFIEEREDRCNHLKDLVQNLKLPEKPSIEAKYECGKFHEIVSRLLDGIDKQSQQIAPTFVFIDPFGFAGVPLELVGRIMSNKKCEVLISFMYEDISRWLSLEQNWQHLDTLFGTEEWREIDKTTKDPHEKVIKFHNLYKKQLEKAGIQFVRSFMMVNEFNKPDYFLFFGTNNALGLEKMKEAMWKVDKFGTFKFSDSTYDPHQAVLFEPTPNYSKLKQEILNRFKGKKVSIGEIEEFVVQDTAFLRTHIRKPILLPMEEANPPEIEVYDHKKRRRGTYPSGTYIEFL